jgi:hypothetical protein
MDSMLMALSDAGARPRRNLGKSSCPVTYVTSLTAGGQPGVLASLSVTRAKWFLPRPAQDWSNHAYRDA